jgi:hypothetical protein
MQPSFQQCLWAKQDRHGNKPNSGREVAPCAVQSRGSYFIEFCIVASSSPILPLTLNWGGAPLFHSFVPFAPLLAGQPSIRAKAV